MQHIVDYLNALGEFEYAEEVANEHNRLEHFANGLDKTAFDAVVKEAEKAIALAEQLHVALESLVADLEKNAVIRVPIGKREAEKIVPCSREIYACAKAVLTGQPVGNFL